MSRVGSPHSLFIAVISSLVALAACGGTPTAQPDATARPDATTQPDASSSSDGSADSETNDPHGPDAAADLASDRVPGRCVWERLIRGSDVPPMAALIPDPAHHRVLTLRPSGAASALILETPPRIEMLPTLGEMPPADLEGATIVFDRGLRRVLLYGGRSFSVVQSRVYALTLDPTPVWSVVTTAGDAPARVQHGAAIDERGQRMFVFGGFRDAVGPQYADTFVLSWGDGVPTWSALPVTDPKPAGRDYPGVIWDARGRRLLIRDGIGNELLRGDFWALTPDPSPSWTPLAPAPPPPDFRIGDLGVDMEDSIGGAWLVIGTRRRSGDNPPPRAVVEVFRMSLGDRQNGFSPIAAENPPGSSSIIGFHPAAHDDSSDRLYFGNNWSRAGVANEIWMLPLSECR